MLKRIISLFCVNAALFSVFFLAACSDDEDAAPNEPDAYAKQIFYNLKLEVVSPQTDYVTGKRDQEIIFRLKNNDLRPAEILSWHINEPANIILYYAPLLDKNEVDSIPDAAWIKAWPEAADLAEAANSAVTRVPVTLNPANSLLIKVPLKFLEDDSITMEGMVKTFAVKGKLNIKTMDIQSDIFAITVK